MSTQMTKFAPPGLRIASDQFSEHRKHIEEMPNCTLCKDPDATKEKCKEQKCCRWRCIQAKRKSSYFKFIGHGKLPAKYIKAVYKKHASRRRLESDKLKNIVQSWCNDLNAMNKSEMVAYASQSPTITEKIDGVYMFRNAFNVKRDYSDLIKFLDTFIPENVKPTLQLKLRGGGYKLPIQNPHT